MLDLADLANAEGRPDEAEEFVREGGRLRAEADAIADAPPQEDLGI
jgi:hypothetical protein